MSTTIEARRDLSRTCSQDRTQARPTPADRQARVVIADGGDSATIIPGTMVPTPTLGLRSSFHGHSWEITSYRPDAKAWVATPVQH